MPKPILRIAALTQDLTVEGAAPTTIKLMPAGVSRGRDGRPAGCAGWVLDRTNAAALVAAASQRQTRYVIDYEHQTLHAAHNGQPAPASGWFSGLEWREDDGLYATGVEWTAKASAMLAAREYRYLSPVFTYDAGGRVTALLHVALTNNPALDVLPDLTAALSALIPVSPTPSTQETHMDELLEQLRWLLNLPVGATADDVKAQLQKLISQLSGGEGMAAASVDLPALLTRQQGQIAALSASQPDPSRFVPVDTMRALQEQVAALTAQVSGRNVDELVVAALSDGRLLPAQEGWARELGQNNLTALKGYLDTAPKIAALSATQTQGNPPPDAAPSADGLSQDALAICSVFGHDPAAAAALMKE